MTILITMELFGLTPAELATFLRNTGEKPFRSTQILKWAYSQAVDTWDEMTNLSIVLRQQLKEKLILHTIAPIRMVDSSDGETTKFLWRLHDNKAIESVLIRSGQRRTVCVSSQVGCPARCAFCASGKKGFFRNLTSSEIVEQVLLIRKHLLTQNEDVSHIVFMGMGEPLENYDSVIKAIRILTYPSTLNISQRRITLSTVGIIEKIAILAQEDLKINLVLSLHAPNQHIRETIIPYAKHNHLAPLLAVLDTYSRTTKRDITFEYTLIHGCNDTTEHAEELAHLLKKRQCTVNLIPYNPVKGMPFTTPPRATVRAFLNTLTSHNITTTCRYTKGDDITAACGQLALQPALLRNSSQHNILQNTYTTLLKNRQAY